ncbi:MAG: hypothetical protein LUH40_08160 [Clostridiales bacterium]|nr:hypothetical protein [Clostridiales bacterium]
MADYTYEDMIKMQKEAADRVREMKKRAAAAAEEDIENERKEQIPPLPDKVKRISYPVELPEEKNYREEPLKAEENGVEKTEPSVKNKSVAANITEDKDAPLIITLASLLYRDSGDYPTALALLYLLF